MLNRSSENHSPRLALTETELKILGQMIRAQGKHARSLKLSDYLLQIAKLGGYLARTSDPSPGNMVMWRGLSRLSDIQLGFEIQV